MSRYDTYILDFSYHLDLEYYKEFFLEMKRKKEKKERKEGTRNPSVYNFWKRQRQHYKKEKEEIPKLEL